MAQRRQEIEAFVRHLVVEVEAAEAEGMTAPQGFRPGAHGAAMRGTSSLGSFATDRCWKKLDTERKTGRMLLQMVRSVG